MPGRHRSCHAILRASMPGDGACRRRQRRSVLTSSWVMSTCCKPARHGSSRWSDDGVQHPRGPLAPSCHVIDDARCLSFDVRVREQVLSKSSLTGCPQCGACSRSLGWRTDKQYPLIWKVARITHLYHPLTGCSHTPLELLPPRPRVPAA